jgi:hypothetical protein
VRACSRRESNHDADLMKLQKLTLNYQTEVFRHDINCSNRLTVKEIKKGHAKWLAVGA